MALLALNGVARQLRLAPDLRTLLFAVLGLGMAIYVGLVASLLGARQANVYAFSMPDVSGLGFVFWGMVLEVMCLQGRVFVRQHAFEIGIIVFYLTTYFLIEVTGRIFECGFILVLLAGLRLTGWRRVAFLTFIVSYGLLLYALRLDEPWMGFGAQ